MRKHKIRFTAAFALSGILVLCARLFLSEKAGVTFPTLVSLLAIVPYAFFAVLYRDGRETMEKQDRKPNAKQNIWIGCWMGAAFLAAIPLRALAELFSASFGGDGYAFFRFPGATIGQGIAWELIARVLSLLLLWLILREANFIDGIGLRCCETAVLWAVLRGEAFRIPLYILLGFALAFLMIYSGRTSITMPLLFVCVWSLCVTLYDGYLGTQISGGYGRWIGMTVIFSGFSLLLAVLSWRKLLKMPNLKGWKLLLLLCTASVLILSGCAITGYYSA